MWISRNDAHIGPNPNVCCFCERRMYPGFDGLLFFTDVGKLAGWRRRRRTQRTRSRVLRGWKSFDVVFGNIFLLLGFGEDRDFAFFLCELRSGMEGRNMYVIAQATKYNMTTTNKTPILATQRNGIITTASQNFSSSLFSHYTATSARGRGFGWASNCDDFQLFMMLHSQKRFSAANPQLIVEYICSDLYVKNSAWQISQLFGKEAGLLINDATLWVSQLACHASQLVYKVLHFPNKSAAL